MMKDDADMCRANGWTPGTRLVGDEGYGPTVIEIRYVGEDLIVAKAVSHNGKPVDWHEGTWTLSCREWRLETTHEGAEPESKDCIFHGTRGCECDELVKKDLDG